MYTHSIAVDVVGLKVQGFMKSEAASVNGGQVGLILRSANRIECVPDLIEAEHGGKALFPFGVD